MPNEAKIIRFLISAIPDELYFTTDELLKICGREHCNLEEFITLGDWSHPDLVNGEKPSEIPCFQSLAEALEKMIELFTNVRKKITTPIGQIGNGIVRINQSVIRNKTCFYGSYLFFVERNLTL